MVQELTTIQESPIKRFFALEGAEIENMPVLTGAWVI
jgi:hypothetical protein